MERSKSMTGKTNARRTTRQSRRGFTLVELLTIIGIIVILLMILFPVISRAITFAKEIQCRSNLTQMGKGLQNYLADNDSVYPFCYSGPGITPCWTTRIRRYMGYSNDVFWCPIRDEAMIWQDINRNDPNAPSGARFANDDEVNRLGYKKDEMLLDANVITFSYGWNDWGAAPVAGWTTSAFATGGQGSDRSGMSGRDGSDFSVTSSMIASPGSMVNIADKGATPPGIGHAFNIDPLGPRECVGRPHNDGCNVLWADGHASWRQYDEIHVTDTQFNPHAWTAKQKAIAALWNNNGHWLARDFGVAP